MKKLPINIFESNAKDFSTLGGVFKIFIPAIGKFFLFVSPILIIIIITFEGYVRGYVPAYIFVPIFLYLMAKISTISKQRKNVTPKKHSSKIKPVYKATSIKRLEPPKKDYQKIEYNKKPTPFYQSAALTLGLSTKSLPTIEQVQVAYKEKMRRAHPDNGGSEALAKALNNARDFLVKEIRLSEQARQ